MHTKKIFFSVILSGAYLLPAIGAGNDLAKIQSQIKQTEQQNKQIEQKLNIIPHGTVGRMVITRLLELKTYKITVRQKIQFLINTFH